MELPFDELLRRLDPLAAPFPELRHGIHRAVKIAHDDPEMSLTRTRKVLECLVRDVYERHLQEPAGSRPLENLLQRLLKDGHMSRLPFAYATAVRELGNVGTHAFGEAVTATDVCHALTLLVPILEWYKDHAVPGGTGPSAAFLLRAVAGAEGDRQEVQHEEQAIPFRRSLSG